MSLLTAGCLGGSTGDQPAAFVPTPIPADLVPSQEQEPTQVPEPISLALWATGLAAAFAFRRKLAQP